MKPKQAIFRALIIAALLLSVGAYTQWIEERDVRVAEAAKSFEECIEEQYGTNPARYYEVVGHLPTCDLLTYQK